MSMTCQNQHYTAFLLMDSTNVTKELARNSKGPARTSCPAWSHPRNRNQVQPPRPQTAGLTPRTANALRMSGMNQLSPVKMGKEDRGHGGRGMHNNSYSFPWMKN